MGNATSSDKVERGDPVSSTTSLMKATLAEESGSISMTSEKMHSDGLKHADPLPPATSTSTRATLAELIRSVCKDIELEEKNSTSSDAAPSTATIGTQEDEAFNRPASRIGIYQSSSSDISLLDDDPDTFGGHELYQCPDLAEDDEIPSPLPPPKTYFEIDYESYTLLNPFPGSSEPGIHIPIGSLIRQFHPRKDILLTGSILSLFPTTHAVLSLDSINFTDLPEGVYIQEHMITDVQQMEWKRKWTRYFDASKDEPAEEDLTFGFDSDSSVFIVKGNEVSVSTFGDVGNFTDLSDEFDCEDIFKDWTGKAPELDFVEIDRGQPGARGKRVRFTPANVDGKVDKGVITGEYLLKKREYEKYCFRLWKEWKKERREVWKILRRARGYRANGIYRARGVKWWLAVGRMIDECME